MPATHPLGALPDPLPPAYWLADATLPSALCAAPGLAQEPALRRGAVGVRDGRIHAVQDKPEGPDPVLALDGATVMPAFVDAHTHLDKGDLLAAGLQPERELMAAVQRVRADYAHWSVAELTARTDFALRTAWAHGSRALNSYCDWADAPAQGGDPHEGPLAWQVLREQRGRWAGRVDLSLTSLAAIDELADPQRAGQLAAAVARDAGVLGWFVYPGAPVHLLPRAFDLAERHGLRLDFHVDEHLDPPQDNLGLIARLARERGMGARTVCGHNCVLSVLDDARRDALLDEVAASGISLVTLPYTNLYLQDGKAGGARRTPRRRGLMPVHEARARGIPVALASDNHRDVFFPAGDLDPLQALALGALAAQLDDPLARWADTITTTPARVLHLPWDGRLAPGAPADLVLHPGRNSAEVLSRPTAGRRVIRAGQWLHATPPDPRELDGLRR